MINNQEIYRILDEMFPNAKCELNYNNIYELLIAVVLSAQTTDESVNKVTVELFKKYPSFFKLQSADINDVKKIISRLGLSNNKSKNIVAISKTIVKEKDGVVPCDFDYLITLPGVGRKTANVILSEGFNIPAIAVDTHVNRVSNRLGLSNSNDPIETEDELKKKFDQSIWSNLHLKLLFFGRYFCKAKNPNCSFCPFINQCHK